eukprot:4566491-Amphidinium_carterae.1
MHRHFKEATNPMQKLRGLRRYCTGVRCNMMPPMAYSPQLTWNIALERAPEVKQPCVPANHERDVFL